MDTLIPTNTLEIVVSGGSGRIVWANLSGRPSALRSYTGIGRLSGITDQRQIPNKKAAVFNRR